MEFTFVWLNYIQYVFVTKYVSAICRIFAFVVECTFYTDYYNSFRHLEELVNNLKIVIGINGS